jgi:hypothetical protein
MIVSGEEASVTVSSSEGALATIVSGEEASATVSSGEGALATIVSGEEASATVTSIEEALATVQNSIGAYLDVHKENAFNSALHEPARYDAVSFFGRVNASARARFDAHGCVNASARARFDAHGRVNASARARFDAHGCVHFYHRMVGCCMDTTLSARIRTENQNARES